MRVSRNSGHWIVLLAVISFLAGLYTAILLIDGQSSPKPLVVLPSATPGSDHLSALREEGQAANVPTPAPIIALPDYTKLYTELSPSVVSISATRISGAMRPPRNLSPWFLYGPLVESPRVMQLGGSGFVLSEDGAIVTNQHVIEDATSIKVALADGRVLPATVVGADKETDLALLQTTEPLGVPAVTLGNSDEVLVGQQVLAIGNPFGLGHSMTTGVVSYKGRSLSDTQGLVEFLQTDMPINQGNSGGPVFDLQGRVIGVNTAIHGDAQGISFAVPVDVLQTVVPALRTQGFFARGVIGVVFGVPDLIEGQLLADVIPGLPAQAAGILPGDRVLSVGDRDVKNSVDLRRRLSLTPIGQSVTLRIRRGDEDLTFDVAPVPLPDEYRIRR